MTQTPNVVCLHKPDTMGPMLATHYADYPISDLPAFATRILAKSWRARPDVFYVEARSGEGEYLGFIFGHSLGEQPWRRLFSNPVWMTPLAAFPVLARRFKRRSGNPAHPGAARVVPSLDLPEFPDGLLGSLPYLKVEYIMVQPQFRGMRIANHLYAGLEEEARKAGVGMMSAHIASHNLASVHAFRRAGWTVYVKSPSELRTIKILTPEGNA